MDRPAQVCIQMSIHSPRDMARQVFFTAASWIRQVETAVHDRPFGISQVVDHLFGLDQGGKGHVVYLAPLQWTSRTEQSVRSNSASSESTGRASLSAGRTRTPH